MTNQVMDFEEKLEKLIEILLTNPELTAKEYLAIMREQGLTKGYTTTNFHTPMQKLKQTGWPIDSYWKEDRFVYRIACTEAQRDAWFRKSIRGPWWSTLKVEDND